MPLIHIKWSKKAAATFRRKATESAKSISDLKTQIVIL